MDSGFTQEWLDQHRDLIRRTICPRGIPDDEFELFMLQCQRSGLDPLLKQAYCVPRESKGEKKRGPDGKVIQEKWRDGSWHDVFEKVTRFEFQPSRDGMLVRANRFSDFRGMQASEVYAEDNITVTYAKDGDLSSVEHSFNPARRKGALVGAWARVVRTGKLPVLVWVDLAAYVGQGPLWTTKPAVMICKVAEATALRKAYPEAFGGLYIAGERPDDQEQEAPTVESSAHPIPKVSSMELPAETATREATPELEFHGAPEKVSVLDAPPTPVVAEPESPEPDAIIAEAQAVAAEAIDAGRTGPALARASESLSGLASRARKLAAGSAARRRVGEALEQIRKQLFIPAQS